MYIPYCRHCVMPATKPDLTFDEEGVCDACRSAEKKDHGIDWDARKSEFESIIEEARQRSNGKNYDCLIPVSGGKDSHYQAYVAKHVYKLNPLLVCFEQSYCTPLGRENVDNIGRLGCDVIYFKKNPHVYRSMVIEGFKRVGDNEWPNHVGIFTVPINIAVKFKIPLIIWGENSQLEYGGPEGSQDRNVLDRRWLEEFGGLLGNRVEDMVGVDGIKREDLVAYLFPSQQEMEAVGIKSIFLGYYFKWDARPQLEIMKKHGFKVKEDGPIEGTYNNYENLDEATVSIHDYLKFVKYGFGRATDHACLDIRNGRVSREEGLELVRRYDGKYPYYGAKHFMDYTGMSKDEMDEVFDRFTNKQLFKCDENGKLIKDIVGNLTKINYDNV